MLAHQFRRGFVEWVSVRARAFLDRPADLFRLAPVRRAFIITTTAELPAVIVSPYLARLRGLGLRGIGDVGAAVLARAPQLAGIEELDLSQNDLGPSGTEALVRSPYLFRLKALDFGFNGLGGAGVEALVGAPCELSLNHLDVRQNRVGAQGARALAASPLASPLETLLLSHNPVGSVGMQALAASEHLNRDGWLSTLDLWNCRLGDEGAAELAAARWARNLRQLNLCMNDIGEDGINALVESPLLSDLNHLDLTGNRINDEARFALRGRFGLRVQL